MFMLYLLGIDFVVFAVSSDKADIDDAIVIIDFDNETLGIALNIENYTVVGKKTCRPYPRRSLIWVAIAKP